MAFYIDSVMNGRIVCNIGQLSVAEKRQLDKATKAGLIFKTRAPFAGRLGALKTYYAASESAFQRYQNEQIAKFDLYAALDNTRRAA